MTERRLELWVGIFVLAGLVTLGALFVFFGKVVTLSRARYDVKAVFPDVLGMTPGTPVRLLGVNIGEIKEVGLTPEGDNVLLTLAVDPSYSIRANSALTIRATGILGDHYLEFDGGHPPVESLPKDGTAFIRGKVTVTLDSVAEKVGDMIETFTTHGPLLSAKISGLADNISTLASSLNDIVGDPAFRRDAKTTMAEAPKTIANINNMVLQVGRDAHDLTTRLKDLSDKLSAQTDRQGKNLDELKAGLITNVESVNRTLNSLNEILVMLKEGKGSLGAVVAKDELYEKLIRTVDDLNSALEETKKTVIFIREHPSSLFWGK